MAALSLIISSLLLITTTVYADDLWPRYGANRENQQFSESEIDVCNVADANKECIYTSPGSIAFHGYIAVDGDNNAYVTDLSGDIFKFNIDSCKEIWRKNIASILGMKDTRSVSRNSVTLYNDIVLFGTPNARVYWKQEPSLPNTEPLNTECYAVGLSQDDGSLIYAIKLNDPNDLQTLGCHVHGFLVDKDNKYAYGGMASVANFVWPPVQHAFQGQVFKINLKTHKIEDIFYTFPDNNGQIEDSYKGASAWNMPALIDDYLVFGTGNLYDYPERIKNCILGGPVPDNNFPQNICGDDTSTIPFWNCLEDNVYVDSIIALNVDDFSIKSATRTAGVDMFTLSCLLKFIPDSGIPPEALDCDIPGPDADIAAIATYKNSNNELIALTTTKSSQFIAVNIETGKVLISKQTGLALFPNSIWGTAVDPNKEIAISTFTGFVDGKYTLPNGDIVCKTGLAHAIDLKTGKTKWTFVVPYGRIVSKDKTACDNPIYDQYFDVASYARCTIDPNGNRFIDDSETIIIIPPISDKLPIDSIERAFILGVVTISNNLVYIPTATGDVYVLRLDNGKFIKRFECPETEDIQHPGIYNRAGIHGGVTVTDEYILFYCGSYKLDLGQDTSEEGNMIKVIRILKDNCDDYDDDDDDSNDDKSSSDSNDFAQNVNENSITYSNKYSHNHEFTVRFDSSVLINLCAMIVIIFVICACFVYT